jgi:hypothetical protein
LLILKNDDSTPTEVTLCGALEVDRVDFFFTPDAKWNPSHQYAPQFEKAKANCHLIPVQRGLDFKFSRDHWKSVIKNIKMLENRAGADAKENKQSMIYSLDPLRGGESTVKLSHSLFIVRTTVSRTTTPLIRIIFQKSTHKEDDTDIIHNVDETSEYSYDDTLDREFVILTT